MSKDETNLHRCWYHQRPHETEIQVWLCERSELMRVAPEAFSDKAIEDRKKES